MMTSRRGGFCRGVAGGLLSAGLLLAAPLQAGLLLPPDPNWQEAEVELPAALERSRLQEFAVEAGNANRHYIDTGTLSVGEDGVVRYVLLIEAAGGAQNISYEGLRCASAAWRRYASADAAGNWLPARHARWQPVGTPGRNRPRATLALEHFCDGPAAPRNREHALRLLRTPRSAAHREAIR